MASNQTMKKCPVCGTECMCTSMGLDNASFDCPTCGRIEFAGLMCGIDADHPDDYDKLASYLYYNGNHFQIKE